MSLFSSVPDLRGGRGRVWGLALLCAIAGIAAMALWMRAGEENRRAAARLAEWSVLLDRLDAQGQTGPGASEGSLTGLEQAVRESGLSAEAVEIRTHGGAAAGRVELQVRLDGPEPVLRLLAALRQRPVFGLDLEREAGGGLVLRLDT